MDSTREYQRGPIEAGPVLGCRQRGMSDAGNQGGGRVDRVTALNDLFSAMLTAAGVPH